MPKNRLPTCRKWVFRTLSAEEAKAHGYTPEMAERVRQRNRKLAESQNEEVIFHEYVRPCFDELMRQFSRAGGVKAWVEQKRRARDQASDKVESPTLRANSEQAGNAEARERT